MRTITSLTLLVLSTLAAAQAGPVQRPHIEVELVSEVEHVQPGEAFRVGLRMRPDEHWHTYWKNPGDSGLSTEAEWTLPEGASTSGIQWPYPERVAMGHLVNYGYGGEHLLPVTITPPADLAPGEQFPITVAAEWLVCEEICVPGDAELSMTLPVRNDTAPGDEAVADLFAWADGRRPEAVDWPARFDAGGGQLAVQVESGSLPADADWTVFVGAENIVDHAHPAETAQLDGLLQAGQPLSPYLDELPEAMPVVFVDHASGTAFEVTARRDSLQSTGAVAAGGAEPPVGFGLALLLALAGGVLLNLMPCVFPVLSIKAMSFVGGAGHDQRAHGLAYTAGVVLSFAVLAGALLALRAGGEAIGWGFQLQSPWVVGILVYVLFALALSLSGLFAFGNRLMGAGQALTEREGVSGSFYTGILACIVASPCTAPFMGTALGAAVLMPWPMGLAVFLALGFGLALPMLALSFSPALAGMLPRPGPWMETFKQLMAFPLYLAVVWLLWVLGRQVGADGLAAVLGGLVVLAFVLWLCGRESRGATMTSVRHVAVALGAVAAVAALGAGVRMQSDPAETENAWWESYSAERLAELRDDPGRAVLVNMTADWCITCKVNEGVALSTDAVREAMAENDVVYMKGDWTRRDDAITAYLSEFDRNGVPLYVLYPHDGGEPTVLPQVLSPGLVVNAVESLWSVPFNDERKTTMIDRSIQLVTAAVILMASAAVVAAPEIGKPAPDFSVVDTKGNVHSLSDFAGEKVILEWTNHECPFVAKHYDSGNMQDQQRAARSDHDVVWLSVISSRPGAQGHVSPEKADELTASRNADPDAVLIDESGEMGQAYDARVTPHMYIIDEDGILRYMGGIDSNPSADPDDIPDATQYVMVALDELAAGESISQATTRPYGCTVKY